MTADVASGTIVHSIREHARTRPHEVALIFTRGEGVDDRLTYGELDRRARKLASRLQTVALETSLALLPMRSDATSVVGLCACLYAGLPCAPVPFPARNSSTRQLDAVIAASGSSIVICDEPALVASFSALTPIAEDATGDADWTPRAPCSSDLAFVQYTSGSSSEPKGVLLSHENLRANLEMLRVAFGVGRSDRFASWLPLFHDMGLAMLLMPLHFGVPGALMPPLTFLRRPERWWQMVAECRATITGAPNFAFQSCVSRVGSDVLAALDLAHVKLAFCGAEPVRRSTMQSFARRFAATGFQAGALFPCYGMAEVVCYAAGGHLDLSEDMETCAPTRPVSCGRPASHSIIRIVDPSTLSVCSERAVGEVWISGPHVASGYVEPTAPTQATFHARLADGPEARYLRTGDLGYLDNGILTIVGRLKDVIIHRGANIHAADVEAVVAACHPSFGSEGAAFAWEEQDAEYLVLVHEATRGFDGPLDAAMVRAALDAVAMHHGLRLFDLVLVRAGTVPKTSSGKIRRDACRLLYERGELRVLGRLRAPTAPPQASPLHDPGS